MARAKPQTPALAVVMSSPAQERTPIKREDRQTPTPTPSPEVAEGSRVADGDVLRIDANLVTVPVVVFDKNGRYVGNLSKDSFRVFENDVIQDIAFFAPVEQPFTVMLLIDVSSSMLPHAEAIARAANAFVHQLRPDDQLIAASFNDWVHPLIDNTKVSDLRKPIKLRCGGSTHLYDAVDYAFERLNKIRGRKALVLFSDGVDSRRLVTGKRNLHDAQEQEALVYTILFDRLAWAQLIMTNREEFERQTQTATTYMTNLARNTGGREYALTNILNLDSTFSSVAEELRTHYSLAYYPNQPLEVGQLREIKVTVNRRDLVVRARQSYLVDKGRSKARL